MRDEYAEAARPQARLNRSAIAAVALAVSCLALYGGFVGYFEALIQRPLFVALAVVLALLQFPPRTGRPWLDRALRLFDLVTGTLSVLGCAYVMRDYESIIGGLPDATWWDVTITAAIIALVLELCRRVCESGSFSLMVLLAILYVFVSHLIPGPLGTRGFDMSFFAETMVLGDLGLWGSLTGLAATTVALFLLFGSIMLFTGVGEAFIDLAMRVSGRAVGGAPKVTIIASSLFGIVTGSSVAGVATTGTITIPLMKRMGYRPEWAAAVESLASTAGQLSPPIMGAAAFIMAQVLGVSYWAVAAAATLPSLLYYYSVYINVHLIAVRDETDREAVEIPPAGGSLGRRLLPTVSSFAVLIAMMLWGYSIEYSVSVAIAVLIAVFLVTHLMFGGTLADALDRLLDGFIDGGKAVVITALLLFGAQVFATVFNVTGLGVGLVNVLVSLVGSNLYVLAFLAAIVCMLAGMGLPTTAAYIITAAVMGPALIQSGMDGMSAHMFIFYYATLSAITPPVAVAVLMAAGIAQVSLKEATNETMKLGMVVYAIPVLFLSYPGMILQGGAVDILQAIIVGIAFATAFAFILVRKPLMGSPAAGLALWLGILAACLVPNWIATIAAAVALAAGAVAAGQPDLRRT